MASTPPKNAPTPPRPLNPMAGVLSYLVPGLGQIVQGRVAKGVLFMVCIYTMFFYGLYIGNQAVTIGPRTYRLGSNVYIPDTAPTPGESSFPSLGVNLYTRPQFLGQFWVGVAVWPAILQYRSYDPKVQQQLDSQIDDLYQQIEKANDDESREELLKEVKKLESDPRHHHPVLGDFQREPSSTVVNAVHNGSDKRLELAWVYTVIAGVLNILVIYDAVAGPAFGSLGGKKSSTEPVSRAA